MDDKEIQPDHGSTLVWSNDDNKNVATLLHKHGGNLDKALKRLFESGGTEYKEMRQLSVRFAPLFGISEADFMKKYRTWRRGGL